MKPKFKYIANGDRDYETMEPLYFIEMWIGVQGFRFSYEAPKRDCKHYVKMVKKALANLD